VGEGNLQEAIANGCTTLAKLCSQTGAGLGCGSCKPEVQAMLEREKKAVTT
jgi:ferredoxin-nitrate reductase